MNVRNRNALEQLERERRKAVWVGTGAVFVLALTSAWLAWPGLSRLLPEPDYPKVIANNLAEYRSLPLSQPSVVVEDPEMGGCLGEPVNLVPRATSFNSGSCAFCIDEYRYSSQKNQLCYTQLMKVVVPKGPACPVPPPKVRRFVRGKEDRALRLSEESADVVPINQALLDLGPIKPERLHWLSKEQPELSRIFPYVPPPFRTDQGRLILPEPVDRLVARMRADAAAAYRAVNYGAGLAMIAALCTLLLQVRATRRQYAGFLGSVVKPRINELEKKFGTDATNAKRGLIVPAWLGFLRAPSLGELESAFLANYLKVREAVLAERREALRRAVAGLDRVLPRAPSNGNGSKPVLVDWEARCASLTGELLRLAGRHADPELEALLAQPGSRGKARGLVSAIRLLQRSSAAQTELSAQKRTAVGGGVKPPPPTNGVVTAVPPEVLVSYLPASWQPEQLGYARSLLLVLLSGSGGVPAFGAKALNATELTKRATAQCRKLGLNQQAVDRARAVALSWYVRHGVVRELSESGNLVYSIESNPSVADEVGQPIVRLLVGSSRTLGKRRSR